MKTIEFSKLLREDQVIVNSSEIEIALPRKPDKYFRHGWQSWSLTSWTDPIPLPIQMPSVFHPLQIDPVYAAEKQPHGSWVGAVEFSDGKILLLGALGTDAHVFLRRDVLYGAYEIGGGDWFISVGNERSVFNEYANHLGRCFGGASNRTTPRVWCSWYSLYTAIDEKILLETFEKLAGDPFDVLQVDDGWQVAVGDWTPNKKFPSGMQHLAKRIRATGKKAGLWLAPLLAVKSSNLFRQHRDWFLRNEKGTLVSAGFNWGEELFPLDTTIPAVVDWLTELMKQIRDWGYDYLKLDFLFAGALKGARFKDIPREASYRKTVGLLRDNMGADAYFLACGSPIVPTLGLCDAIRIGPDVSHIWEKYRDAVLLYNPTIPSARNALRTAVHRIWLKSIMHIDSDVVYFARKENNLTDQQKMLLQDLALICNFKATSDLPQWMTGEEGENLKSFLVAKPQIIQLDRYKYRIDDREVDFESAVSLPDPADGFYAVWGRILGRIGNLPFALRIQRRLDNKGYKKRRESLDTE